MRKSSHECLILGVEIGNFHTESLHQIIFAVQFSSRTVIVCATTVSKLTTNEMAANERNEMKQDKKNPLTNHLYENENKDENEQSGNRKLNGIQRNGTVWKKRYSVSGNRALLRCH